MSKKINDVSQTKPTIIKRAGKLVARVARAAGNNPVKTALIATVPGSTEATVGYYALSKAVRALRRR